VGILMSEVPEGFAPPKTEEARIRPSASLVATRDGSNGIEILFCHRVPQMPSFPDFWAFPGGGVTRFDRNAAEELTQLSADENGAALVALMREMVEEIGWMNSQEGVVIVDSTSRDSVVENGKNWHPLVIQGELLAEPARFKLISIRTTPPLSPMRFTNRFFHLHDTSPPEPTVPNGRSEFDEFRWLTPKQALDAWNNSEMRIPPPQITLLRDMIIHLEKTGGDIESATTTMCENPPCGEHRIEFAPSVECIPLPTYTLPPATHTNCYIIGDCGGDLIVVDPAAKTDEGLTYLERRIRVAEEKGGTVIATIFTHRHPDHIGDLTKISNIYQAPIWATEETHSVIPSCDTDRILSEGDSFTLGEKRWDVLETPGHCPGHICLSSDVGMISGDMAVMVGTILIPPSDGDMAQYLSSLERMRDLKPPILLPAHGPLSPVPEKLLNHYLKHRRARHDRVLDAVKNGISEITQIANYTYEDTPDAHPILKVDQTLSHLHTHERDGNVKQIQGNWHLAD
jgi:endoribonuclease LACTB2